MDNAKTFLCIYAGGVAGVAAALFAATVLSVATPVALGIAYTVAGGSIVAAASMND